MNRLFGAKKSQVPPPPPPKVQEKKQQEVKKPVPDLSQQQKRMQNKVRELSQTITLVDNQMKQIYEKSKTSKGSSKQMYKQRCIQLLKKRKLYQQQLKSFMTQQYTLDQVAFTKQSIQNTIQMGVAMKGVVQQQKKIFEELDMDELDDIRDEMDEMRYQTEYMNELMNRDYQVDVDEADLDDELLQLDAQFNQEMASKKKQQMENKKVNENLN